MIRRKLAPLALVALAGCAAPMTQEVSSVRFAPALAPTGVARSNADLAEDFLDLTFGLESGETFDHLLRYEGPVRIDLASASLAPYRGDLETLVARLRSEARLDVSITDDAARAQIRVEAVPGAQLSRVFPSAACFIVPGETSWRSFLRNRSEARRRWSSQKTLEGAAIFLPQDATPQDVRDCLHEEITQALGPANDLYRLPDSIWNDDNLHGIATPFDMLMLRVLYQPELHSGMTRDEVAAKLPALLRRENPKGRNIPRAARYPESRAWGSAIEIALSQRADRDDRVAAARLATQIAAEMRPVDHRLAVSLLTLGRLTLRDDKAVAARQFGDAYAASLRRFGAGDLRSAQSGIHVAAIALAAGDYDTVITLADLHAPTARNSQNAILLAGLLSLKAEAQLGRGEAEAARATRIDSLRWARYGFGDASGAFAREQAELSVPPAIGGG